MRGSYRVCFRVLATAFVSLACLGLAWPATAHAAPQSGITITPAALNLDLAKGQNSTTTSFEVTNSYRSAASVSFVVEPNKTQGATLRANDLHRLLILSHTTMVLESGQTTRQTITLTDDPLLPPGSQALNLLISQQSGAGGSVGVASRIQLPLTLIKRAGAVASFNVTTLNTPGAALTLPSSVRLSVRNTGNVVVIPRGYVVLSDPRGTIVAKGTLNSSSLAVAPHATLALQTAVTNLDNIRLPGPYKATAFYGLGGGQALQHRSARLWFIAWWQLVGFIVIGPAVYYGVRAGTQKLHARRAGKHRPLSKRGLLAGGGST